MSKFDKFADAMSLAAEKIDGNKYLSVIKNAFSTFMPFIIVGSFASLGNYVLTNTTTGLARFFCIQFSYKSGTGIYCAELFNNEYYHIRNCRVNGDFVST